MGYFQEWLKFIPQKYIHCLDDPIGHNHYPSRVIHLTTPVHLHASVGQKSSRACSRLLLPPPWIFRWS